MASREKSDQIIRLISSRFRIDFQLEDLAGWRSVLDAMTDARVADAEHYLNHNYRGDFPPQPAEFKVWSMAMPRQYQEHGTTEADENYEQISGEEYARRIKDLGAIWDGSAHRDIDWRNQKKHVFANDQDARAWQRRKLGWK